MKSAQYFSLAAIDILFIGVYLAFALAFSATKNSCDLENSSLCYSLYSLVFLCVCAVNMFINYRALHKEGQSKGIFIVHKFICYSIPLALVALYSMAGR